LGIKDRRSTSQHLVTCVALHEAQVYISTVALFTALYLGDTMAIFEKIAKNSSENLYLVFRVLVGLLFLSHGAQKLGFLGGNAMTGFMLFIGIVEFLGGTAIAFGFLTRLAALLAEMLLVYIVAHASHGIIPLEDKGELALLYLGSFLVIFAMGGVKYYIDNVLFKKELF
jgi:putative oxidoreductase